MVSCSSKIVYNKQRIRKDGQVSLYLRVIIDNQKKDLDLKLLWPVAKFDPKKGRCLALEKGCEKHKDHNIFLQDAEARATEIFVQYRLQRIGISLSVFVKEYQSGLNRNDFIAYYEKKMYERLHLREITEETVRTQRVTLNHLRNWKTTLPFCDINNRTAQLFDIYLQTKTGSKKKNARFSQHKNVKTYLNQARKKDNIHFVDPYLSYSPKSEPGRFQPLTKDQLVQLFEFYSEPLINLTHKRVLRAFLFGCFTGMRHSDIRGFDIEWIDGELISFTPHKTRKHGTKVKVPLTKEAMGMIADEIEDGDMNKLFSRYAEQTDNDVINEIAGLLDIKMKLCFQIARETFATLYMEHDGKIEVLASFLGHKSIKMTEKYVKIMDGRKKTEGVRISDFVKVSK